MLNCLINNCKRKYKTCNRLKIHIQKDHLTKAEILCNSDNCNYMAVNKLDLKQHQEHKTHTPIYICKYDNCIAKYHKINSLNYHYNTIHNNKEKLQCVIVECTFNTHYKPSLDIHIKNTHGIGMVYYKCDICNINLKTKYGVKMHKANIHNIDVTWYICDIDECSDKFKNTSSLKTHKMHMHNIGITWHYCDIDNCCDRFKLKMTLIRHHANIHNINVIWYECDQDNCIYRAKHNSDLIKHKKNIHNVKTAVWRNTQTFDKL